MFVIFFCYVWQHILSFMSAYGILKFKFNSLQKYQTKSSNKIKLTTFGVFFFLIVAAKHNTTNNLQALLHEIQKVIANIGPEMLLNVLIIGK
jgi:hypothetical protein